MRAFLFVSSLALLGLTACNSVSGALNGEESPPARNVTTDTTILDGDTIQRVITRHWYGSGLESADTAVIAVTEFVWLVSHYNEPVVMEAWVGDSLEWRNGNVLGFHLKAIPDPNIRAVPLTNGARRRLCARRQSQLLVVAGILNGPTAEFLSVNRYTNVSAGDSLVLDDQGVLQRKRW